MKRILYIFGIILVGLVSISMSECNGVKDDPKPVSFVSADPVSGSTIQQNQLITITFDRSPAFVNVSEGTATLTDNTLTIAGPFKPEALNLVLDWDDGVLSLTYHVESPPVKDPPKDPLEDIIQDVWVDYDTWENGQKGMRVHVKFTVSTQENSQCSVVMCFEYRVFGVRPRDWRPLIDVNGKYVTTNGEVAVAKNFTHHSFETTYDDFNIFMPYSELHADNLKVEEDAIPIVAPRLRCVIKIENRTLSTLLDSSQVNFKYFPPIPDLAEAKAWAVD